VAGGTSATVTNAMFTDAVHWGIGAAYTFDAITVAANYGQLDRDNAAFDDQHGYGLVAQYDFGGGLSAHFGYGYSEVGAADASNWSLGLSMSF
jgi:outer membrane protein OmpU